MLPKVKLGQIAVGLNIAQNQSFSLYEVISGHYFPKFIKFTKSEIMSSARQFKHLSKSQI